eukprot:CAMPEP_0201688288 /NCGR_PEP_ID=MMETSP0578-20130828/2023_1 /ASSEMBLY_ACC=CAM_ASM_000663 /TAXON_ID=267565 /ORGANISM="Skeletonema grethea, Strain CCMP 1804" /LENGTH=494 /DNA_ID=CAMNT_0048172537 /DNA_START=1452 /DNA_END=2936 /DNA_ORIENTATION=-
MATQDENAHSNIRPHYSVSIKNGQQRQKRLKAEGTSNNIAAYPSAAIHAKLSKLSKRSKRKQNKRSNHRSDAANVYPAPIFKYRKKSTVPPSASKQKASKKRRSNTTATASAPPAQKKKMSPNTSANKLTATALPLPAKKKIAQKKPTKNDVPIFNFKHRGEAATAMIAPLTATASKAKVSKKRRSDSEANESVPPAQKKKMTVPTQKKNTIQEPLNKHAPIFNYRGQVAPANQFTSNNPAQEKMAEPLINNVSVYEVEFAYSDSDSDSEEGDLVGMALLPDPCMSNDDAATTIQAFFRGCSTRTMKPRSRPELDVQNGQDQEWDGNFHAVDNDDLADAVEGEEGDEKEDEVVDFVDAVEGEEGDEKEKEVVAVADYDKLATTIQANFRGYHARKVEAVVGRFEFDATAIDATAMDVNDDGQESVNFDAASYASESNHTEAGEEEEDEVNEEEEEVEVVQPAPRKRLRMLAELQSTLDGRYWREATTRRVIDRD